MPKILDSTPFKLAARDEGTTIESIAAEYTPENTDAYLGQKRNHRNATLAARSIMANPQSDEPQTLVADLFANARHLCDLLGLDADELWEKGFSYYYAEVTEEA